jgi:uncharacterized membrane protein
MCCLNLSKRSSYEIPTSFPILYLRFELRALIACINMLILMFINFPMLYKSITSLTSVSTSSLSLLSTYITIYAHKVE